MENIISVLFFPMIGYNFEYFSEPFNLLRDKLKLCKFQVIAKKGS